MSSTAQDPRDTSISKLDEISEPHRFFIWVGVDNKEYWKVPDNDSFSEEQKKKEPSKEIEMTEVQYYFIKDDQGKPLWGRDTE